jgi:tetratricopeptide (TPR) repeat protein
VQGSLEIDPSDFVSSVRPLLQHRDLEALVHHLRKHWTSEQLASLLSCPDHDARKVAALALSLVGGQCCIPALIKRLRDRDPMTNQMAEHALWSIWFRGGSPAANAELAHGAQALNDREFERAFAHFGRAIQQCPQFAEAFNQRAIGWYMLEDYDKSADDCRRAVELMPMHFGAWAGLGHCHAHAGRMADALACYEKALHINPHLDCIRQAIAELKGGNGAG